MSFKNHFCPICLSPVDPKTGDHWTYCEYEASTDNWINPQRPLTEVEMLNIRLSEAYEYRSEMIIKAKKTTENIDQLKLKIKEISQRKK